MQALESSGLKGEIHISYQNRIILSNLHLIDTFERSKVYAHEGVLGGLI